MVYGRTGPLKRGGQKKRQEVKDPAQWTVAKVPDQAIISPELWAAVQTRRAATLARYAPHRAADGELTGRPEAGLIASHLLNGFLVCPCGGAMTFTSKNGSTKSYCVAGHGEHDGSTERRLRDSASVGSGSAP